KQLAKGCESENDCVSDTPGRNRALPKKNDPWQPNRALKVIQQIGQRHHGAAEGEQNRSDQSDPRWGFPGAQQDVGATRGHRVVKNKAEAQRGKESKEVKSKAGRIENRRLKLGNDRKPARHVAVPKRQLVGSERLGDAELDRVEVSRQVAKEGELSGENN